MAKGAERLHADYQRYLKFRKDDLFQVSSNHSVTVTVKAEYISPRNPAKFDGLEDMSDKKKPRLLICKLTEESRIKTRVSKMCFVLIQRSSRLHLG